MERGKKMLTVIGIVVGSILVLIIGMRVAFFFVERNLKDLKNLAVSKVDTSKIPDGAYRGAFKAFPVDVEVSVRVEAGRIGRIDILKHVNGQGKGAEVLPARVVETQNLNLDAVTGATYSSKVILKAIENALLSAPK